MYSTTTLIWGYYLPMVLCLVGYGYQILSRLKKDITGRKTEKYYSPDVTIGSVIGKIIVSICPLVNILAFVIDLALDTLALIINKVEAICMQPLVPRK